jgi:hypothetical protein
MNKLQYDPSKVRKILVEVDLSSSPAAGSFEFTLGSVPQLRDCTALLKAEAMNTTLMSKTPSGAANAPDAAYKTMYLSIINSDNTEIISRKPLATLIRSNGNSAIEMLNIFGTKEKPQPIDPQRSKVICGDCSTITTAQKVLIEFTYVNP